MKPNRPEEEALMINAWRFILRTMLYPSVAQPHFFNKSWEGLMESLLKKRDGHVNLIVDLKNNFIFILTPAFCTGVTFETLSI